MEDKKQKLQDNSEYEEVTWEDVKSEVKGDKRLSHGADGGRFGKWMISITLCSSFLGLGMCSSVLGPTLEDLAINVNKNISKISYIFAGQATGYIGGSLLGGILFDLMNPHLLLGFSMLMMAFGMFATPFCKQALILTLLLSVVGMSMGILDTGGNVLILNTWADKSGPHIHALHFTFATGAFASPIIAKLLFGHRNQSAIKSSDNITVGTLPFFHVETTMLPSMWAYVVIATFALLVSFVFFVLYTQISASSSTQSKGEQRFSKRHVPLISLLSLFFFFYVGAEMTYGSYIFTYAKGYVGMEEPYAAKLNSLFWGSLALCRGAAIYFATCLYPGTILLSCIVGTVVAAVCLALFNQHQVVLWTCTALFGASIGSIFPTGISWVEQYTTVTGKSASAFMVGSSLGEMVLPVLLGFLMGYVPDKPLLMYMIFGATVLMTILFPVMYKLASSAGGALVRKQRGKLPFQADDSEDWQPLLSSIAHSDTEKAWPDDDDVDTNFSPSQKQ